MDGDTLLRALNNPDRAWLVLFVGLVLIYRELTAPGRVLPGMFGALAVIASVYSLFRHPWSGQALSMILAGIVLVVAQAFGRWFWLPGILGTLLITVGAHRLTFPPISLFSAIWAIPMCGISIFLLRTAVLARRKKVSVE
jgi:membrane-bound serine protease (ClpP class)